MFYRLLTRLAGQILLILAAFVCGTIAIFDEGRGWLQWGFGVCALLAIGALVGLKKNRRWTAIIGAIALFAPIGLLAHHNGASPWAWLFWLFCMVATERWLRDAVQVDTVPVDPARIDAARIDAVPIDAARINEKAGASVDPKSARGEDG